MMNSKIQKAEDGKNAGSAKKCVQTGKKVADKKEANKKQAAQVAVFENPEFGTVRTATDEKDEPWFCAKDLCDVLGYKRATDAVKQHVRSSDTAKYRIARTVKNRFGVSEGKVQNVQMNFVNESGFYALVLGSKLATAVKFKDWVTSVVLPQIRKTGGYIPVRGGDDSQCRGDSPGYPEGKGDAAGAAKETARGEQNPTGEKQNSARKEQGDTGSAEETHR